MALLIRAFCMGALLLAAAPAAGQREVAEATQVKAAYVYKFGSFVEWPAGAFAGPDGNFVIGVIGADALAAELEKIVVGRTIHERAVTVRRIRRPEAAPGRIHILFVGESENARLQEIVAATDGKPVLLVTESESSLSRGSAINFVAVEDKLRFDVALAAAERERLKISARLLSVARKVLAKS